MREGGFKTSEPEDDDNQAVTEDPYHWVDYVPLLLCNLFYDANGDIALFS